MHLRAGLSIAILLILAACGSGGPVPKGVKVGKPYVIDGKTYYPAYDNTYDKIGDASWYGPGFHGKYTANGEIFNQDDLTAAHPTLPMPSIVRVTNLENGRSAIIRINDRGPFKKNRIIDLSRASARKLGVHSIHRVRVQFLPDETQQYLASVENDRPLSMASLNEQAEDKKENALLASTAPQPQIVESTIAETQPGQTVGSAAPVLSVDSGDIGQEPAQPRRSPFIRQAMADDTVVSSGGSTAAKQVDRGPSSDYATKGSIETQPVELIHASEEETRPAPQPVVSERSLALAAPSAGKAYMIQAGSFSLEANAQKLTRSLKSIASLADRLALEKVDMGGKQWWRVRAGPFGREEAENALEQVRSGGAPEARIVQQ